jgi:hypothetical protein
MRHSMLPATACPSGPRPLPGLLGRRPAASAAVEASQLKWLLCSNLDLDRWEPSELRRGLLPGLPAPLRRHHNDGAEGRAPLTKDASKSPTADFDVRAFAHPTIR